MDQEDTAVQLLLDKAKQLDLKGEYDYAIARYTKVLALNPNCVNALEPLGLIYERRKEFEQAINYRKRIVKLKPHNSFAHAKLARVMMLTA